MNFFEFKSVKVVRNLEVLREQINSFQGCVNIARIYWILRALLVLSNVGEMRIQRQLLFAASWESNHEDY